MDIRNCRKCSRLFNYSMGPILCPKCKEALEVKFQEVKKYIFEHKGCGIAEVSEDCDVTPQQIRQWLREERLEFSSDSATGLECENCGTLIRSGRFCEKCKAGMVSHLQTAYKKEPAPEKPKPKTMKDEKAIMRYLDH
ncbi:MAG: flagellar protein [Clostridiales bacterium]|nr:flagellar protein [Clostridiales bacterium]